MEKNNINELQQKLYWYIDYQNNNQLCQEFLSPINKLSSLSFDEALDCYYQIEKDIQTRFKEEAQYQITNCGLDENDIVPNYHLPYGAFCKQVEQEIINAWQRKIDKEIELIIGGANNQATETITNRQQQWLNQIVALFPKMGNQPLIHIPKHIIKAKIDDIFEQERKKLQRTITVRQTFKINSSIYVYQYGRFFRDGDIAMGKLAMSNEGKLYLVGLAFDRYKTISTFQLIDEVILRHCYISLDKFLETYGYLGAYLQDSHHDKIAVCQNHLMTIVGSVNDNQYIELKSALVSNIDNNAWITSRNITKYQDSKYTIFLLNQMLDSCIKDNFLLENLLAEEENLKDRLGNEKFHQRQRQKIVKQKCRRIG